jgi:hypothetical protein
MRHLHAAAPGRAFTFSPPRGRNHFHDKERKVSKSITVEVSVSALKSIGVLAAVSALVVAGACTAQGMLQDYAADKVIQKFQAASCEQLKAQKTEPPTEKEKAAVAFLRNDDQARKIFIDKIAAPVLNKMFECGMIP